jgi:hypothetical protein
LTRELCQPRTICARQANLSACEGACAADAACAAVAMQDGEDGTSCNMLKQPLVMWDDGKEKSHGMCSAATKQHSSNNLPSADCGCYKFNHVAVGRQLQGSGVVPGMPCDVWNSSASCGRNGYDGCTWMPACCAWGGRRWDCGGCPAHASELGGPGTRAPGRSR